MPSYVMLLAPSANRVYTVATPSLAAAELTVSADTLTHIEPTSIAEVEYLGFHSENLSPDELVVLSRQSTAMALFERSDDTLLRPIELPHPLVLDDDLVTIPKYPGKTNELFTRLLLNVTISQLHGIGGPLDILDPLAGRGTTLLVAWTLGHNGFGVEADEKAFQQTATYLKTYLRRKRLKHSCDVTPVRREGKLIGHRLDAQLRDERHLMLTMFTGDTRDSAALFGKKQFDAIVTDAPYGVVHGSRTAALAEAKLASAKAAPSSAKKRRNDRDRSPVELLSQAIPVWSRQLRPGGAIGLSWNSHGLDRGDLAELFTSAGLRPCLGGTWERFAHRVDAGINRDLMVAVKPSQ